MKRNRKYLLVLAAVLSAAVLAACSVEVETPETPDAATVTEITEPASDETEPADTETFAEPEAEDSAEEEQTAETEEPKEVYYNRFTGLPASEQISKIRPLAVMINNIQIATPQQGISMADVIYEVLAEGGITRLLCIFTDYANLPETGSIRSSRDYFIDLAEANDAIYIHCGGSPAAYETLKSRKNDHIDGIFDSTTFYRNQIRAMQMGYEHSLMSDGERLAAAVARYGFRDTSESTPFAFNETDTPFEGDGAVYVKVPYSTYTTAEFTYDAETKVYSKKQFGKDHIDGNTGEAITFKNIVLIPVSQGQVAGDDKGRLFVNFFGEGKGTYISDGVSKPIVWKRADRRSSYTLYEADGKTELLMNPGITYVGLPPKNAAVTIFAE